MLRAEQLALIQEANQQLLAIRQQEMEYYTNTFASFGTQGSLLAGFTLGALTGLDMRDFDQGIGLSFWKGFFHILAAVAMGGECSDDVHVRLLVSMMIPALTRRYKTYPFSVICPIV